MSQDINAVATAASTRAQGAGVVITPAEMMTVLAGCLVRVRNPRLFRIRNRAGHVSGVRLNLRKAIVTLLSFGIASGATSPLILVLAAAVLLLEARGVKQEVSSIHAAILLCLHESAEQRLDDLMSCVRRNVTSAATALIDAAIVDLEAVEAVVRDEETITLAETVTVDVTWPTIFPPT